MTKDYIRRIDTMLAIAREQLPREETRKRITRFAIKRNPRIGAATLEVYAAQTWLLTRVAPYLDRIARAATRRAGGTGTGYERHLLSLAADTARRHDL